MVCKKCGDEINLSVFGTPPDICWGCLQEPEKSVVLDKNIIEVEHKNQKVKLMNVTTPDQMSLGTSKLEEAIYKFEQQFAKSTKDLQYYHLVITGEYNRQTCDEIERIYTEAGWPKVKCRTSSENGERGGLTALQLYRV